MVVRHLPAIHLTAVLIEARIEGHYPSEKSTRCSAGFSPIRGKKRAKMLQNWTPHLASNTNSDCVSTATIFYLLMLSTIIVDKSVRIF